MKFGDCNTNSLQNTTLMARVMGGAFAGPRIEGEAFRLGNENGEANIRHIDRGCR
jgi:hypothetical protein